MRSLTWPRCLGFKYRTASIGFRDLWEGVSISFLEMVHDKKKESPNSRGRMDFLTRSLCQMQECMISWHWVRDFWKAWKQMALRGWSSPFLVKTRSQTSCIDIIREFVRNAEFQAQIPAPPPPLPSYWIRTCVLSRSPGDSCEQFWSS